MDKSLTELISDVYQVNIPWSLLRHYFCLEIRNWFNLDLKDVCSITLKDKTYGILTWTYKLTVAFFGVIWIRIGDPRLLRFMAHQRSRWNSDQTGIIGSFYFRDLWWMANARLREAETSVFLRAQDILTSSMARSRLQVENVLNASSRCLVSVTITHHLQKKPNSVLWDFLSFERPWDNFARKINAHNRRKSVKFDEHFARPMSFEGPFANSWITDLNPNHPEETRPKRNLTDIWREKIAKKQA